jgi:hypothetical protein
MPKAAWVEQSVELATEWESMHKELPKSSILRSEHVRDAVNIHRSDKPFTQTSFGGDADRCGEAP